MHTNGAAGDKLLPETMGGGCAFLDFDGDGDQDLLLVNSGHWPASPGAEGAPVTMALYRNNGAGRFEDVTAASGLEVGLYGMGAAIGILGALMARHTTGKGQYVDVSLADGIVEMLYLWLVPLMVFGIQNKRCDTIFTGHYPWYNVYETKDGGYVSIAAFEPCETCAQEFEDPEDRHFFDQTVWIDLNGILDLTRDGNMHGEIYVCEGMSRDRNRNFSFNRTKRRLSLIQDHLDSGNHCFAMVPDLS